MKTEVPAVAIAPERTDGRPAAWMVSAAFSFATMGSLAHALGPRCHWFLTAFIRIVCTFGFSVGLARLAGVRLVVWRPRTLWVRSLSGTVSLLCSFYAVAHLPVADVLTLTNTYPLWIVLLSLRHLKRDEVAVDLICVLSGVLGVALIQRPYLSGHANVAVLVALLGSVTTAIAMLGLHRLRNVDPRAVVAHFSGLASLILLGWLFMHQAIARTTDFNLTTSLLLLGVGVTGTAGQVLITKAFAAGSPSRVAVLSLTQVIFAMCYDVVLEGRVLEPSTLLGFLMVLIPTAWITLSGGRIQHELAE